jgi:hypothetical protein
MSTMSELVQTNFKLTAEVRRLKDELATLKAVQHMEDSDEVARIKAAYTELETEVVALRKSQLRSVMSTPAYDHQPLTDNESLSVISLLSDQLESERNRYIDLESRYQELRKDVSEESSTCVGSPPYQELCVEQLTSVVIGCDSIFFDIPKTRRVVVGLSEPARQTVSLVPPKRASSKSIERLSKIARFKPRH